MPTKKQKQPKKKETTEESVHEFVTKDITEENKKVKKPKKKQTKKKESKKTEEAPVAAEPETTIEFLDENDKPIEIDQKKIDEQLTEIYENKDGSMPDMSSIQKTHRSRLLRAFTTLLFACLFLGAIAWAGFFIIQPQSSFSQDDVIVSISGEENVDIGEEVRYRIRYRNAQNVPLAQAVLQVRYPEGFVFKESSAEPSKESNDEWALGTLEGHDSGFIDVFGTMYGDVGKRQSFRVFLNYLPANFSSEFQKVASVTTEMKPAPVTVSLDGPKDVAFGAEASYTVQVQQQAGAALQHLAIEIEAPVFRKTDSEPASDQFREDRWTLDADKAEQEVTITGAFNGDFEGDASSIGVRVVGWKDEERKGDGYIFATSSIDVAILRTELSAQLVMNGASGDFDVQPGERLNSSIVVKNVGQSDFEDMQVRLVFETPSADKKSMLYWKDIQDAADGDIVGEQINNDRRRGQITWTKRHVKDLATLSQGDSAVIDVSIPIKNAEQAELEKFAAGDITAYVEIRYDVGDEQKTQSTSPIAMTINSDLAFEIRDEVRSDAQERDVHIINWVLTNQFHGLENLIVTADVYGDITWDESLLSVPAGDVVYDAEKQKITWTIPMMPTEIDTLALQFGLLMNQKNPSQTQLTSKAQLKATDTITKKEIVKIGDEILLGETAGE